MKLEKLRQDWDSIAEVDALWGVLSAKDKKGGKWDIDEFFQSGATEIKTLMARIRELGIELKYGNALDFGCGAGRLTRALASYFQHCEGVDISAAMIDIARKHNPQADRIRFSVNHQDKLDAFDDSSFDFIYSTLTLQHMETRYVKGYVKELVRTLKTGGLLVFQMISYLPWLNRLQPKRRLYALLRALGLPARFLFYRLDLAPIRMSFVPEDEMVGLLTASGSTVRNIDRTRLASGIVSSVYFVTR